MNRNQNHGILTFSLLRRVFIKSYKLWLRKFQAARQGTIGTGVACTQVNLSLLQSSLFFLCYLSKVLVTTQASEFYT
jgi:hypothetical protein